MAKKRKRPIAVFHFRKYRAIATFIGKARGVVFVIGKRKDLFPKPVPALSVVKAHIKDLDKAETVVRTRLRGSAARRDLKYDKVCVDIAGLLSYVQALADSEPDVLKAINLITCSGFSVKGVRGRGKEDLKALTGRAAGQVKLMARSAGKRTIYNWQKSPDKIRWTDLTDTPGASTVVTGLSSQNIWHFRYRTVTKEGESEWSHPVSAVVP